MIRDRIIRTARSLFAQQGICAVSMGQIAREAGVPEKSVYAEFSGMADLLEECLNRETAKIETSVSAARLLSQTVLETLILVMYVAFKEKSEFCDAFYEDLGKYPGIRRRLAVFNLKIQSSCAGYFMKCMDEGYFTANENRERMALIYMEEICNLATQFQHAMIKTLIKGICTPKGLDEAARIQTVLATNIDKLSILK